MLRFQRILKLFFLIGAVIKMVKEIRWNKWKPNKSNKKILNDLKEIYVRL